MPPRDLTNLVIANGQTESAVIDLRAAPHQDAMGFTIVAPTTLPETVTVHAAARATGLFQPYQQDGVNLTIPAAKTTVVRDVAKHGIGAFKLVAGAAVAAERAFEISAGQAVPT